MVSFKGKPKADPTQIAPDFKVYSDTDNVSAERALKTTTTATKPLKTTIFDARKSLPAKQQHSQLNLKKSAGGVPVTAKFGQKVLGDVTNIFSRNKGSDASKPLKAHNEKNLYGTRVPFGQCNTGASASSKISLMGKTRTVGSGSIEGQDTSRKFDTRGFKVCSETKGQGRGNESFGTDSRKIERKPLGLTRKSLPVVRTSNLIDKSASKGNIKGLEKGSKVSIKLKVGRKVVPDVSNTRKHLSKNRGSDAIISMESKAGRQTLLQGIRARQNVKDSGALARKSLSQGGKTTFTVSRNQVTSKSKPKMDFKKSTCATATSSKMKEKSVTKALRKSVGFEVSGEGSPDKLSSDGNSGSSMGRTVKCSRRQSFTSSLVAKPEAMKVFGKVTEQKELPCIDDNLNHLEVAEYVDEIYQYYWVMEAQYPSLANYMMSQTNITPKMREILVNWLIEVHFKFELMQETLFLMVALFDRFLSVVPIERNEMQLVGLTALLLASKYEDFWHPRVKELISIAADPYTRDQMLAMEKLILKKLMFRLNIPTPYVFMLRFLKAAESETKLKHLAFYLIELCLVEYEALKFKPSLLCASAIYVARCTLEITPAWTPLLCKHAHYEQSELRSCANMILRFHKAAGKGQLKVTYHKHMSPDHSRVAALKPLNMLSE